MYKDILIEIYMGIREVAVGPSRIDIHEHKAPTDESMRMLDEFKKEAIDNIIDNIKLKDTVLDTTIVYTSENTISDSIQYYCIFELNGKKHRVEGDIFRADLGPKGSYGGTRNKTVGKELFRKVALEMGLIALGQSKEFKELTGLFQ